MRGMVVVALASLAIPLAFLSPFLGLLAYCWLSYMRPQDMAWGVGDIQFGLYVSVALFAGLFARLRFEFFRWSPITWALLALWTWWGVCTYTALDRGTALQGLTQISRIFLVCLVTTGICTTKHRLRWVVAAIAGSLLFHGTKLGIHGILRGGAKQLDPIGGLLSGNNENAIALAIALPFAVHFAVNETRRWLRTAFWAIASLTAVAIVCTYSRGGFLGLAAAGAVLLWHSRARWMSLLVVAPLLAAAFLAFAPDEYRSRVAGIDDARRTDLSAQRRLMAWGVAAEITADHPVTGIGPKNFYGQSKRFTRPSAMPDMEIHNTYLDLSSSLGLPGLAMYLVLTGLAWTTLSRVRRDAKGRADPRIAWFGTLATAIQAALAAFAVSSTFGSLAHFDLAYHLCALAACLPVAMRHESDRIAVEDLAAATPPAVHVAERAPDAARPARPSPAAPAAPAAVRTQVPDAVPRPSPLARFYAPLGDVAPGTLPDDGDLARVFVDPFGTMGGEEFYATETGEPDDAAAPGPPTQHPAPQRSGPRGAGSLDRLIPPTPRRA